MHSFFRISLVGHSVFSNIKKSCKMSKILDKNTFVSAKEKDLLALKLMDFFKILKKYCKIFDKNTFVST